MKALVIENQYDVDPEIEAFIHDSELFDDVKYLVGSKHRPPKELLGELKGHDALIVASTFMDKDQLEKMAEGLALLKGKKIYVRGLETKLEEWFGPDSRMRHHFYDWTKFKINLKHIFDRHEVYSFDEDWLNNTIKDEYWEWMQFTSPQGRGKFECMRLELPEMEDES